MNICGLPCCCLQVDASNAIILQQHLLCAAAESPLIPAEDEGYFGPSLTRLISELSGRCLLQRHPRTPTLVTWHYVGPKESPAADVTLRTIDPDRCDAVCSKNNRGSCCSCLCSPIFSNISRAAQFISPLCRHFAGCPY